MNVSRARRMGFTAVLFMLLLSACGSSVTVGTVVSKQYQPAYSYSSTVTIGNCPCYVIPVDVPECWSVAITDGQKQSSYCLGQQQWQGTQIGDHVDYTPPAS
jgi:hypothetical protein